MNLSIIIVNYNVTELLRKCLSSIDCFVQNVNYEVIIIDNNSSDASWQDLITEFPKFKFIASETNEGFAIANNKAVKEAVGNYILLLNPDTEFEDYDMTEIIDFANSRENFGCLGVHLHDAEGNFLPESKRSVPDMFNSFEKLFTSFKKNTSKSYYRNDIGEYEVAEVDVVTGAFLLIKKSTYEEIGGLDEKYFMYGEDIDLCFTLLRKNYKNWYYGKSSILHHKGESTVKDLKYLERFYGAMQIFVDKYYKKQKPIQYGFLYAGLKLRHTLEKNKRKRDSN
ncbi:glycosyltransferase family 2 protein [Chryseobacterium salivictor]|uniref:N-acetylglucosaminyl-diphospho-decaprenol L-rhamnosyltransferase n=1 Tax=Chryseobacterium salivictor TaxID=2547600 RepID=A0A4P6ZH19_9FLAO|nr:glycosyltransferase family 2 protein [Chryseobacterium salivictor]QBO58847.1 N-acetylglucosaminyl-diphospho-decaprenol L-rhamnosyltransferase [Chryseobacterium salivictor]